MKIIDLLNKYEFRDFAEEMKSQWAYTGGGIGRFKEAFDLWKSLDPKPSDQIIEISKSKNGGEEYVRVKGLSGYGWPESLSFEIDKALDIDLTEKEMLALILWERTFYGYSPEEEEEEVESWSKPFYNPKNPYSVELLDLERKRYKNLVPKRLRQYDEEGFPNWVILEEERRIKLKSRKRKAYQRFLKSKERLEFLSECYDRETYLLSTFPTLTVKDLEFIYKRDTFDVCRYNSRCSLEQRAEYINELITLYPEPLTRSLKEVIIFVRTSPKNRLNSAEEKKIVDTVKKAWLPASVRVFSSSSHPDLGKDLQVSYYRVYAGSDTAVSETAMSEK